MGRVIPRNRAEWACVAGIVAAIGLAAAAAACDLSVPANVVNPSRSVDGNGGPLVFRTIDAEAGVVCYSDYYGISCLPLSATRLAQPEAP